MSLKSPLRYPGGKQKLFSYTKSLISENKLSQCTYIEPFAGGAGLALKLLSDGVVENIVLNDVDKSIYAIWYSILNHTDELCNMIINTEVTMDTWKIQKEKQLIKNELSLLELGFSTFFLNRTNRSGIITGGVIGGKDQTGNYKLDCRFNKDNLISRIRSISEYRNHISLYNLDALHFIKHIIPQYGDNSFVFLDPPYYKKGPKLYLNYYTHQDHLDLSTEIEHSIKSHWIITYDNTTVIKDMYTQYRQHEYDLTYSAQKKCKGKEVMIYSNNITSTLSDQL